MEEWEEEEEEEEEDYVEDDEEDEEAGEGGDPDGSGTGARARARRAAAAAAAANEGGGKRVHLLEIDDEVDEDVLLALLEVAPPAGENKRVAFEGRVDSSQRRDQQGAHRSDVTHRFHARHRPPVERDRDRPVRGGAWLGAAAGCHAAGQAGWVPRFCRFGRASMQHTCIQVSHHPTFNIRQTGEGRRRINEDLAALFHGTYARLAFKARRLLPCVLCAVRPRVHLVVDDKVERVLELVVSCVAVPVLPLQRLHHQGRHHRRHHHRSHRRGHHHEDEPWEGEEDEEGSPLAALPPLVAPPPPLLPPGLSAYMQALSLQHTTQHGSGDDGGGSSPKAAGASGGSPAGAGATDMPPQQLQSPSLPLPLSPLLGVPPSLLHPAPPTRTTPALSSSAPSSSSLIGRVASLTKSGGQTLLRRGQRALQLAATPLFSSTTSSSRSGPQPPPGGAALSSLGGTAPAATSTGGMGGLGLPDPRSLVELTPLASVPGTKVVRYLGAWSGAVCSLLWVEEGAGYDWRTDGVTWMLIRFLVSFLPSDQKQAPCRCTL